MGFRKILLILGGGFVAIGLMVAIVFLSIGEIGFFLAIPFFFVLIGLAIVISVIVSYVKEASVKTKGTKYKAKIYSYVDDTSVVVNGAFQVNCKVHFFDRNGIEKEAIIPTAFARGSSEYPIGMTIDIFEYNGRYGFDKNSVRDEVLDREEELMDDKPIDRAKIRKVAISCQSCGITYEAIGGYSASCPYCGNKVNAPKVQ